MPQLANETEAQLTLRASRGDERAFGELYEIHMTPIYRYLYYRTGDVHEAEDLCEQVFLNAWEKMTHGRRRPHIRNFRAWVYRIAHNLMVDHYRQRRPHVPLEMAIDHPSGHASPDEAFHRMQEEQRLSNALSQLESRMQQVILCRMVAGLSHAETAEVVGLKESHVRVLQHRALKALRVSLLKG